MISLELARTMSERYDFMGFSSMCKGVKVRECKSGRVQKYRVRSPRKGRIERTLVLSPSPSVLTISAWNLLITIRLRVFLNSRSLQRVQKPQKTQGLSRKERHRVCR